jgi:SAM-dependent methyltransferase
MTLVEQWDRQQERYIAAREDRFAVLLSVIEWHATGRAPVVVDLGCGPGAIGTRLLDRLPDATYLGVDLDPVLLHLARRAGERYRPGAWRVAEADMAGDGWVTAVPAGAVDVVCSSTALHWLAPEALARTLALAHRCLAPGGLLLNADHLADTGRPSFDRLARWADERDQATAGAAGAPDWDGWWRAARADPELAALCVRRDLLFPPATSDGGRPALADFVAAATAAGFAEVGTVWQRYDDRIVLGVKG